MILLLDDFRGLTRVLNEDMHKRLNLRPFTVKEREIIVNSGVKDTFWFKSYDPAMAFLNDLNAGLEEWNVLPDLFIVGNSKFHIPESESWESFLEVVCNKTQRRFEAFMCATSNLERGRAQRIYNAFIRSLGNSGK